MSDTVYGQASINAGNSEFNANTFLVKQLLAKIATATLAQVMAVTNAGGVSPVGAVDVLPLVNQIDGSGNPTPWTTIYNLPYFRLQGGANAIILDPQVGDIGIVIFASRDISTVKATKGQANPGSNRRHSWADGLYIGGVLNGTMQQYVQFTPSGINVVSPTQVTIQAPNIQLNASTAITYNAPNAHLDTAGNLTVTGDVIGGGHSLDHHVHGGVQNGSGSTSTAIG